MVRKVSFLSTKPSQFQKKIKEAALLPGCYIYKNAKGKILYIGKAKVLRNRVKSYFSNYARLEVRIQSMLQQAVDIEYMFTDSEVEALVLESNLIKKYKPKYNAMLVDDKSYIYVKFPRIQTSEKPQPIPTIQVVRQKDDKPANYYGPFPDSRAVKRLIARTRKIFPYCTTNTKVIIPPKANQKIESKSRPCFYYQIGLCSGACGGMCTRGEYEYNIRQIERLFKGEKSQLVLELESQMKVASKEMEFEKAAKLRNMLRDIKYVGVNISIDKDTDEYMVMAQKQEQRARSVTELIGFLAFPAEKLKDRENFRIECYDISNIQGHYAVASMVVNVDGQMRPDLYRRFRIQMKNEPNDFAMMQEVLTRRFRQLWMSDKYEQAKQRGELFEDNEAEITENFEANTAESNQGNFNASSEFNLPKELWSRAKNWQPDDSFSQYPDLIIVDGGKGQLSSAFKILQQFKLAEKVPIAGLAKREEDIFKVNAQFSDDQSVLEDWEQTKNKIEDDNFTKIHLPRRSEALYLIQRIRDEAHRFAITYHRKVRSKAFIDLEKK